MFSLFGKKSTLALIKIEEAVWSSKAARLTGITQHLMEASSTKAVLLIYFFERTLQEIEQMASLMQKPMVFVQEASQLKDEKQVFVLSMEQFEAYFKTLQTLFKSKEFTVICVESYPLPTKEETLAYKLGEISLKIKAYSYIDFDSPLLKLFGGERALEIMKTMGMQQHESISHSLVSKSIREVKKKIAASIGTEQAAVSMEDWFQKNTFIK